MILTFYYQLNTVHIDFPITIIPDIILNIIILPINGIGLIHSVADWDTDTDTLDIMVFHI
jgi:hypothetical protein